MGDNDFNELFEFSKLNKLTPKKGRILISEPFLEDDYFSRAVVLIGEHNEEGTFGFILNHYVELELTDVLGDFPSFDTRIGSGGPVKTNNLYYIHTLGDLLPGSLPLIGNIYMGGNFDHLKKAIELDKVNKDQIRFFLGYSGWTEGQLKEEIAKNAWLVSKIEDEDAMDTEISDLWEHVLRKMGKKYSIIANFPEDPTLN